MKTDHIWPLRRKKYQRVPTVLKIIFSFSLLSLAGCSQLSNVSLPLDWIKTGQSMVKEAVSDLVGKDNAGKSSQYPKLSMVPSRPTLPSTSEDRAKIRNQLLSDKKNARYIGTKSKLWPNSMPFKSKPIAPIKPDTATLQPKISTNTSTIQKSVASEGITKGAIETNNNIVAESINNDQQTSLSQPAPTKSKSLKFKIPVKLAPVEKAKAPLKFQIVDSGASTNRGVINFNHGSYKLSMSDRRLLLKIALEARDSEAFVRVVGHASMRTRDMNELKHTLANFNISVKRAEAVAAFLIANGVKAEKLIVDAVGDSQPLNHESMPAEERANRRAEIFLLQS